MTRSKPREVKILIPKGMSYRAGDISGNGRAEAYRGQAVLSGRGKRPDFDPTP